MQVQFNTPRGMVTSRPDGDEDEWTDAVYNALTGVKDCLIFEDINGDVVFLPANIIKESVISFIETGV